MKRISDVKTLVRRSATIFSLLIFPAATLIANANAGELAVPGAEKSTQGDLSVRVGAVSSDNIGRDAREKSAVVSVAGITADLSGERSALDWSLNGSLDYYDYSTDEYDKEIVGSAVGRAALRFFDDRMSWNVSNEFGQLRADNLAPEGPANRARFNVIETGPTIELPLSAVTAMVLDARYAERSFEEEGRVDSGVTTLQVGLVRALNAELELAIFGSAREIDFDSDLASDYEVHSGFVRLTKALRDQDIITLDVGKNSLKPDGGQEDSGLFARVSASQKIGARSRLVLRAVQDYQDAGYALRDTVGATAGAGADQLALTSDPMERRSFGADFNVTWDRTQLGLMAEASRESYETETDRNREANAWAISVGRSLTPEMRLAARVSVRQEEFSNSDETADEQQAEVSLSRRVGRSFAVVVSYQLWERDADTSDTFTENRVMLTLQYSPWGQSAGVPSLIR